MRHDLSFNIACFLNFNDMLSLGGLFGVEPLCYYGPLTDLTDCDRYCADPSPIRHVGTYLLTLAQFQAAKMTWCVLSFRQFSLVNRQKRRTVKKNNNTILCVDMPAAFVSGDSCPGKSRLHLQILTFTHTCDSCMTTRRTKYCLMVKL